MSFEITRARPDDDMLVIGDLIFETDLLLFPFLLKPKHKAVPFWANMAKQVGNRFSYQRMWSARQSSQVVGILIGYDDKDISTLTDLWQFAKTCPKRDLLGLALRSSTLDLRLNSHHYPNSMYIQNICVHENFRRQGIATAMIQQFAAEAQLNKYAKVFLDVSIENPTAKKVYENQGFRVIKQKQLNFRGHNLGTYLMEKILSPQDQTKP